MDRAGINNSRLVPVQSLLGFCRRGVDTGGSGGKEATWSCDAMRCAMEVRQNLIKVEYFGESGGHVEREALCECHDVEFRATP
jgi:hypothetical protein